MATQQARVDGGRLDPASLQIAECDLRHQRIRLAILDRDVDAAIGHAQWIVEIRRSMVESLEANPARVSADDLKAARIDVAEAAITLQQLRGLSAESLLREAMMYRP